MGLFDKYFEIVTAEKEDNTEITELSGFKLYWYCIKNHFLQFVQLNLLFIGTSLLIISIPASINAMTHVCQKRLLGKRVDMVSDYMGEWKKNFWKTLLLALFLILMFTMVILAFGAFNVLFSESAMMLISIVCIIFCVWIYTIGCYMFGFYSIVDLTVGETIQNAVLLSFAELKTTVLMAVIPGTVIFLLLWFFPITLIPLLIIGFSGTQLAICVIEKKAILKYSNLEDEDIEEQ